MAKNHRTYQKTYGPAQSKRSAPLKIASSLLDEMQDGYEYESIINIGVDGLDLAKELKRAVHDISIIRKRPTICYMTNVIKTDIKSSISIEPYDDLPFSEMVNKIEPNKSEIDVILVTPGGRSDQVAKFVDKLRPRFSNVQFILPFMCMSAGTMFCLSGDDILMDSRAYIGPIDPQIPTKDGIYVPAQALQVIVKDIQKRGLEALSSGSAPAWTDLQILNHIDPKDLGNSISISNYCIELVVSYLEKYKLKNWTKHKSTGNSVTDIERHQAAEDIAKKLCSHEFWKIHSRGISRELAYKECKIKIIKPEDIEGLQRAIRRLWALTYWMFERSGIAKIFISENYSIFRSEAVIPIKVKGGYI